LNLLFAFSLSYWLRSCTSSRLPHDHLYERIGSLASCTSTAPYSSSTPNIVLLCSW